MVKLVPCFPRGGKEKLVLNSNSANKTKYSSKSFNVEKDLFHSRFLESETKKIGKKNIKKKNKQFIHASKNDNVEFDTSVVRADLLAYSDIVEGMKILGAISDIKEFELKISLPGFLVGIVPITNISHSYTEALREIALKGNNIKNLRPLKDMFNRGQVVACVVKSVDQVQGKGNIVHSVKLSLSPSDIQGKLSLPNISAIHTGQLLTAAVCSFEDHGYVMDVGVMGVRAFLSNKNSGDQMVQLGIGQLLICVVEKVDLGASTIILSAKPNKILSNRVNCAEIDFHSLLPGSTFEAIVERRISNGLRLSIVGTSNEDKAIVLWNHLTITDFSSSSLNKEIIEKYPIGSTVFAHVLYIMPTLNTIYVSLKFALGCINAKPEYSIGKNYQAKVISCTPRRGLILMCNDQKTTIFVPSKNINHDSILQLGSNVEAVHLLRYSNIDGIFVGSMSKHHLDKSKDFIKVSKLVPGDRVSAVVKGFVDKERGGMLVTIDSTNVEAFVPWLHISDVPLKKPWAKFAIGSKINCKVLLRNPKKRQIHLTAKSILVNNDFFIVASLKDACVGVITEGVVIQIKPVGILLQLFGGKLKGFVPKFLLSTETIEYPDKMFFLGQCLKCQIVKCDLTQKGRRITLSLLIGGTSKPFGTKEKLRSKHILTGHMYQNVIVLDKVADGLIVEVMAEKVTIKGFIPKEHLTDNPELSDALLNSYKVGDVIDEALCFDNGVTVVFSLKPTLISSSTMDLLDYEDLNTDTVLPGTVSAVKDYGIFIRLAGVKFRKTALVPLRFMTDSYIEKPTDVAYIYQTIFAKVMEKDDDKKSITMSTKLRDVFTSITNDHELDLVSSYLKDFDRIQSVIRSNVDTLRFGRLVLGTTVIAHVKQVDNNGKISLDVKEDTNDTNCLDAIVVHDSSLSKDICHHKIGESLFGVVLYQNFIGTSYKLEVSVDSLLVKRAAFLKPNLPKLNTVVKALVVLIRPSAGWVLLNIISPSVASGYFVYVSTRHHVNDVFGYAKEFSINEVYAVQILRHVYFCKACVGVIVKQENSFEKNVKQIKKGLKRRNKTLIDSSGGDKEENENNTIGITDVSNEMDDSRKKRIKLDHGALTKDATVKSDDPGWEQSADYNPWTDDSIDVPKIVQSDCSKEAYLSKDGILDFTLHQKTRLSKKQAKNLTKLELQEIEEIEARRKNGDGTSVDDIDKNLKCASDFEKILLGHPNSSFYWIKFMSFYLQQENYDGARNVAKRALEKICFRQEKERLNIYVAIFNLENSIAENEEATKKSLSEALKCNDQFDVYNQVGTIYTKCEMLSEAEDIYKNLVRKFNREPEAWTSLGLFYFRIGRIKDGRFTLQRAIQNLAVKQHIEITVRFAQFEFRYGEVERGKTIFETVLASYCKRIDIWCVYVDAVIKYSKENTLVGFMAAREIFDRMIGLDLPPKKMKNIFKKYLEFEESFGPENVRKQDEVRKKALAYVESKIGFDNSLETHTI